MPYLHDSHLDYNILKGQRKKFIANLKLTHELDQSAANLNPNNQKDEEDDKLSKLDVDLIYRDCDKDRVNKTIIRNLIDTESISMRN